MRRNDRTQPTGGHSPLRETDRPDLSRPPHATRRPIVACPPPTARWPDCPAGWTFGARGRALRKAQRRCGTIETNRLLRADRGLGGALPLAADDLAIARAADPSRKSPSASPSPGPVGSGPDRTVACQRRTTRLQGRASLKAAIASPDTRTGANPFLRSRDPVRDPSPRTARLPAGASTGKPSYRLPRPPVSRHKRRLDRLASRPQPTPAAAIARLRIKSHR